MRLFILSLVVLCCGHAAAQKASSTATAPVNIVASDTQTIEQQITAREREFSDVVKARNVQRARAMQANGFRLLIRVEGPKLVEVAQEPWLKLLPRYVIDSYRIDDIKVLELGDVAIATLAFYQLAHIEGDSRNITGEFMLTDVWVKRDGEWKIIERHSSHAERASPN
jgi:ketosteroid isomerase-like protein